MSVDGMKARVMVMDTCGAVGSVALAEGGSVLAEATMPGRAASAQLLATVRDLLAKVGWTLANVDAVGVVSGPGSFTGVRVGLAAAKGLCEAMAVPMAAVSRLEVLAEQAGEGVVAVLDGGRGEVYVREGERESLVRVEELAALVGGRGVVVAEEALVERLGLAPVRVVALSAGAAVKAVARRLERGGSDVALVDANYVRGESQIYASKAAKA